MSDDSNLPVAVRASQALGFVDKDDVLKELAARSSHITEITNPDGYQQVHQARVSLKTQRIEIEKLGKKARDEANEFAKGVIAEERRLISFIEPEETRLGRIQKAHDDAEARQKQLRVEAELTRVRKIQEKIEMMRAMPSRALGMSSADAARTLAAAEALRIDETFEEFMALAQSALQATVASLRGIVLERQKWEEDQAKIVAEREELAKLRADAMARELRERDEARERQRAENEKMELQRAELHKQQVKLAEERATLDRNKRIEDAKVAEARRVAAIKKPTAEQLVDVVAKYFSVPSETAAEWLALTAFTRLRKKAAK